MPRSIIEGLNRECGQRVYEPYRKLFPDGEQYVRLDLGKNADIVSVVQSLYPDQDRKLVELYLVLEALQGLEASIRSVILLYTAYARQDKRFLIGEPISVRALYQGLRFFGIGKLVSVDVHSPKLFAEMGLNYLNIVPHSFVISKTGLRIDMALAPDKGALGRAEAVAKALGVGYDYLEKYRDRITGEIVIDGKAMDVKDRDVAIIDDIISTGKTLAKASEALYKAGAKSVYAVITHALLSSETIEVLSRSGIKKLIIANTIQQKIDIPKWIEVVDLSPLLCEVF